LILTLAELVVSDVSLRVGDVHGWPVPIAEGTPDRIVDIQRDRLLDAHILRGVADVVDVVLELELGCMDADHGQSQILVLLGPGANISERAEPVDARVGPEVDEKTLPRKSAAVSGGELSQPVAP
jgi:hypothetical protein